MADTIAVLNIVVDSRQALAAAGDLTRLAQAAGATEAAFERFAGAAARQGQAVQQAARATDLVARAAQEAARSIQASTVSSQGFTATAQQIARATQLAAASLESGAQASMAFAGSTADAGQASRRAIEAIGAETLAVRQLAAALADAAQESERSAQANRQAPRPLQQVDAAQAPRTVDISSTTASQRARAVAIDEGARASRAFADTTGDLIVLSRQAADAAGTQAQAVRLLAVSLDEATQAGQRQAQVGRQATRPVQASLPGQTTNIEATATAQRAALAFTEQGERASQLFATATTNVAQASRVATDVIGQQTLAVRQLDAALTEATRTSERHAVVAQQTPRVVQQNVATDDVAIRAGRDVDAASQQASQATERQVAVSGQAAAASRAQAASLGEVAQATTLAARAEQEFAGAAELSTRAAQANTASVQALASAALSTGAALTGAAQASQRISDISALGAAGSAALAESAQRNNVAIQQLTRSEEEATRSAQSFASAIASSGQATASRVAAITQLSTAEVAAARSMTDTAAAAQASTAANTRVAQTAGAAAQATATAAQSTQASAQAIAQGAAEATSGTQAQTAATGQLIQATTAQTAASQTAAGANTAAAQSAQTLATANQGIAQGATQAAQATTQQAQSATGATQAATTLAAANEQSGAAATAALATALRRAQAMEASAVADAKAAKAVFDHARATDALTADELELARALAQTERLRAQEANVTTASARAALLHHEALDQNIQSARGAGVQFGNLGQQIQDVAVQASAGTDSLIILAQQGPQIASSMGPAGIAVGAVIGVAAAAAIGFNALSGSSDRAAKAAEEQKDKTDELLDSLRVGGATAEQFGASLDSLNFRDRSQAAASLAAQVDTLKESLKEARDNAEEAAEAIPKAFRAQAQPVNPTAAGPFVGAIQAAREERLGTNRAGEAEELLAAFRESGEGADDLRTKLIALGQAQGLSATEAQHLANDLVNTSGQAGLLERSTAELEARQRIAANTASDLDRELVAQADSAAKAASAFDAFQSTITSLRDQRVLANIIDPVEKAIEEANQRARLGDRPDSSPAEAAALRDEVIATQGALAAEQKRKDAEQDREQAAKRRQAAEEAAAKRIAELQARAAPDDDKALEQRVRTQSEGATEAQIQEQIRLEKQLRATSQAKRESKQVDTAADRRSQFAAGLDLETEQLGRLQAALGQSSEAYEHEANVLEVIRRVRAAGFDVSTAEGRAMVERTADVRDETEALRRQGSVRRELDSILDRAVAAPGLGAGGEEIDLPGLVGLTPQAIDEVTARAEFVRSQVEKLGKQPAEVIARETQRAIQSFNVREEDDAGPKGARATAELTLEAQQQERLGSVIRDTAAARQEMADRIAAENKALSILGNTTTDEAKVLIETDLANRRRAQGIESATQLTIEYADATATLRDRLDEINKARASGLDPDAAARAERDARRQSVRDTAEEFEQTDDPFKGVQAGLLRLQDQTGTLASTISGELSGALEQGVSGFVDLGMAGELTWDTLGDGLANFATDITASIAKVLIMRAILGGLGLGGFGGPAMGQGGNAGGVAVGHQGAIIGEGGAMRMADPMWFANAPRYHSGGLVLGRDEVPIIAERGERVQSRQEVAGQWGMQKTPRPVVNIHNYTGEKVEERERDGPNGVELDVMIGGSVNRHIASGRASKPLKGKYALKDRLY